jgi:phosphatidylserine/phosphatidylglycerophosphate/cardiolipin synthase-like enzyme
MKEILEEFEKSINDFVLSKIENKLLRSKLETKDFNQKELKSLRQYLFNLAQNNCQDNKHKLLIKWLEKANNLLLQKSIEHYYCNSYFSPGADCYMAITKQLRECNVQADICVFTISDNRIRDEIINAINRGVNVRIISDDDKTLDKGSDIEFLSNNGADVRIDHSPHHMHHKFAIFDRQILITGSYNWTRSASELNPENILETNNADAVEKYCTEFERLWQEMYKLEY